MHADRRVQNPTIGGPSKKLEFHQQAARLLAQVSMTSPTVKGKPIFNVLAAPGMEKAIQEFVGVINSLRYLFNALSKQFFGLLLIVFPFSIYILLHFLAVVPLIIANN
jgi:hypothetical protein